MGCKGGESDGVRLDFVCGVGKIGYVISRGDIESVVELNRCAVVW